MFVILQIVLQQMLNGSSQSQCLETFYEQFPDFEEDKVGYARHAFIFVLNNVMFETSFL